MADRKLLTRIDDDDLERIENFLMSDHRGACFFPIDADYLANIAMLLIKEVREIRGLPKSPHMQHLD